MSATPFVSVRGLRVEFPDASGPAVDGVSFDLAAGECLAIVGESGSGKTMTASSLLGLVPPAARVSAERMVVAGVDTAGFGEREWRGIRGRVAGLVSQDALVSLDPLRRVGREVAEPIEVHETVGRDEVARRVLALLAGVAVPSPGLRARQYPHELSGGLRQRALVASALAAGPALLVADEPTTALDSTVQAQILRLLAGLKDSGIALLLVSHDLSVVRRLADRVAVMRGGRILETGPAESLLTAPTHPYTRMLLDAVPGPRTAPPRAGGPIALEARGLVKSYRRPDGGSLTAVDGVSFALRTGTTLGIVGESGSGKSTLARLLLGLEPPDAGQVLLSGAAWSSLGERRRRPLRRRIQLIDQDPFGTLDPRWPVRRILREALALGPGGASRAEHGIRELLERVGLGGGLLSRRPHQLSGGQRQRVAIARALARRPEILVCDEPVSALDVSVQAQVLDLLESLQRDLGLSMVFISHDLAVIGQVSDEILVMKDGRAVEQGSAADVLARPAHPFTRELLDAGNLY